MVWATSSLFTTELIKAGRNPETDCLGGLGPCLQTLCAVKVDASLGHRPRAALQRISTGRRFSEWVSARLKDLLARAWTRPVFSLRDIAKILPSVLIFEPLKSDMAQAHTVSILDSV